MRLEVGRVLVYVAHADATCQQADVAVVPLVLDDVYAASHCGNGASVAEDILAGNAVVAVERAVETGIEHHAASIGPKVAVLNLCERQIVVGAHVEILRIPITVVVEHGQTEIRPHKFVHHTESYRRGIVIVDITECVWLCSQLWEMLQKPPELIDVGWLRLRYAAVAGKHEH